MENKIKFSKYFNDWLYGKDGYYSNYKTIGKSGDFYTAVSSSKFFGGTIGKRVVEIIESNFLQKDTTIIEIGSHYGYLLADMIQFIFTLKPELIRTLKFAIVERYENLRIKQLEYFKDCFGDDIELIHFNDVSEVKLASAFIVANEIFDAFPCELVYQNKENIIHLELSHRWHSFQLIQRLNNCLETSNLPIIIGIDRSLYKKPEIKEFVDASGCLDNNAFLFRDFPGVEIVKKHLNQSI